jgi:hypothetical protein
VLVRFLDERPSIGFAGCVWNPYGFTLPSKRYREGWTPDGLGRDRLRHVQGGAWIARRSVFERYGLFAEDDYPHGGMDVEFSYRLLSHGEELGHCPAITAPPYPEVPEREAGVFVYHPASDELRREVRSRLAGTARSAAASGRGWGGLG